MRRLLCLMWLSLAVCTGSAAPAKPNLVFILTDNQGAWTLGCYGNPDIRTPHIDRLAAEGTLFTRSFSSPLKYSETAYTIPVFKRFLHTFQGFFEYFNGLLAAR